MFAIGILWVGVAAAMWLHHKVTHRGVPYITGGPAQQTFLGALMWPFYLIGFFASWVNNRLNNNRTSK